MRRTPRDDVDDEDNLVIDEETGEGEEEGVDNMYSQYMSSLDMPGVSHVASTRLRRLFAVLYAMMGLAGVIWAATGKSGCTRLSGQVTAPNERIGRTNVVGVSESGGSICPPFVNAIAMLIVGMGLMVLTMMPDLREAYCASVDCHQNGIMWVQLIFQAAMIVLAVFPLAGVVNTMELVAWTFLAGLLYSVMWMGYRLNSGYFNKRDFLKLDRDNDRGFSKDVKDESTYGSWFRARFYFYKQPYITVAIGTALLWIMGCIHMFESINAPGTRTVPGLVVLFFLICFIMVVAALASAAYVYEVRWFDQYRNFCLSMDVFFFTAHCAIFVTFLIV